MGSVTSILWFVCKMALAFGLIVGVHELGHFCGAKAIGAAVRSFAIGWGRKKLWSRWFGTTEYSIRWLPLGGFVYVIGEVQDEGELQKEIENTVEDPMVREYLLNPSHRLSNKHPLARLVYIAGGPAFSILFGIPIFLCLLSVYGETSPKTPARIQHVDKNSPAAVGGLQPGDQIAALDGVSYADGASTFDAIRSKNGETRFTVIRDGSEVEITCAPLVINSRALFGLSFESDLKPVPRGELLSRTLKKVSEIGAGQYHAVIALLTGRLDPKHLSGPIGIFGAFGAKTEDEGAGYLALLGMITVAIGVFNLLPIYPFDGGHIVLTAVEAIRGKPLPEFILSSYRYTGIVAALTLIVFTLVNDTWRLLS